MESRSKNSDVINVYSSMSASPCPVMWVVNVEEFAQCIFLSVSEQDGDNFKNYEYIFYETYSEMIMEFDLEGTSQSAYFCHVLTRIFFASFRFRGAQYTDAVCFPPAIRYNCSRYSGISKGLYRHQHQSSKERVEEETRVS